MDVSWAKPGDVIDDLRNNPDNWEKTGQNIEPAKSRHHKDGASIEETFKNKETGELLERHVLE